MNLPSHAEFTEQIGTTFQILFAEDSPTDAELIEVTELKAQPPKESFSVYFRTQGEVNEQAIYRITHPVIGEFELFLVPVAHGDLGIRYEAVFSRMTA